MAPQKLTAHNGFRISALPCITIVEGVEGPGRREWIERHVAQFSARPERTIAVSCRFDSGGPWAGVSELFLALLPEIRSRKPDLLDRHSAELLHILPQLEGQITDLNLSLTDLANDEEKVRNYAADRAFRNAHGLIDLLDEWNASTASAGHPWIIACDDYDDAGKMCSYFFRELVRRRGNLLNLYLLVAVGPGKGEAVRSSFTGGYPIEVVKVDFPSRSSLLPDQTTAERLAHELEAQIEKNSSQARLSLDKLIHLWTLADRQDKILQWRYVAMSTYLHLGLYEDALRYGRNLLVLARQHAPENLRFQFWIVIKTLNGFTGIQDAQGALKFLDEASTVVEQATGLFRAEILYLTAMVYARYLKPRDYAKGEEYLDRALQIIQQSNLPADEVCFQQVFNRNGLAMIRNFQGRREEAIGLCQSGLEQLQLHLAPDKHRLHKSILIYNVAQVYSATRQLEKAIEYYSAAMEMDPNYSEYHNERGGIYLRMGRLEEALADLRRAVELSPPYFEVFVNLGQCYREMGLMEEAIQHYSRALDLQPDLVLALLGRAQARDAIGLREDAKTDYSAALALDPRQSDVLGCRGALHYEMGDLGAAVADLNLAIQLDPQNSIFYQNRAIALADMGRIPEAVSDLQAALSLSTASEERADIELRLEAMRQLTH